MKQNPGNDTSPGKNRQKTAMVILGILAAVLLAVILIMVSCYYYFLNQIQRPEKPLMAAPETAATEAVTQTQQETLPPETTEPPLLQEDYIKNILLIGQAYRPGEDSKLADSIILATVNRNTRTLTLTSFLRDTYIQMPNFAGKFCGKNRINVVYNLGWRWAGEYGGMEMMDLCMEQNFGIHVDHNIEIGFETFSQLVDTLGGLDLEITEEEAAYLRKDPTGFHADVQAGMTHMDGYRALCYVRMRKIDSDRERSNRQRKVISEILGKVRQMRPRELGKLVSDVLPLVITDMSNGEITEMIRILVPMLKDLNIETAVCPAEGTYRWITIPLGGYQSDVLKIDLEANRDILRKLCEADVPLSAEETENTERTEE